MTALLLPTLFWAGQPNDLNTQETARLCRDGLDQSRLAIKTLVCRFEIRKDPHEHVGTFTGKVEKRPASVEVVEYSQDGNRFLSKFTDPVGKRVVEFLGDGQTIKYVKIDNSGKRGPKINKAGGINVPADYPEVFWSNAWWHALLTGPGMAPRVDFSPARVKSAERVKYRGADCIRLVSEDESVRSVTWFDIAKNYLVRRIDTYGIDDGFREDYRTEHEVIKFGEYQPGIYFPSEIEQRDVVKSVPKVAFRAVMQSVLVNEPVDPTIFAIRFPEGTNVTDYQRKVTYRTGPNEEPVTPAEASAAPTRVAESSAEVGPKMPTYAPPPIARRAVHPAWWAAGILLLAAVAILALRGRLSSSIPGGKS